YHALNPFDPDLAMQLRNVREILESRNLSSVIETGARFLLDCWRKHQPTLVSAEATKREQRLNFLQRAVDIARELGSQAASFWAGAADNDAAPEILMRRLVESCACLCDYAGAHQVRLAFEPEPGMFIDSMTKFAM